MYASSNHELLSSCCVNFARVNREEERSIFNRQFTNLELRPINNQYLRFGVLQLIIPLLSFFILANSLERIKKSKLNLVHFKLRTTNN